MDGDVERLGHVASAIVLLAVCAFVLLRAVISRRQSKSQH
jgi:hypothetical protein